jgi:NAD(P)-dependent dehydrogenase (short-subunit alcohol dehydrogenase family)
MEGKRVLVTGAGTGIGRGVALEFAAEGAAVVLHYCHSSAGCQSAVAEIRSSGGRALALGADFRRVESVQDLAARSVEYLGGIDVLVNNSGVTANSPFEETTPHHFDTLFDINFKAMFFLTQAVLPAMVEHGGGSVINLTSVHAYAGLVEHSVYAATKGAIVAFTREVSLELIQKGVRVNAIAPGWIRVPNQDKVLGENFDWEAAEKTLPAGFIGTPRDIGGLAVFLASGESRYIVGQTLVIDGGQLAIMPNTGDFRGRRRFRFGEDYVGIS